MMLGITIDKNKLKTKNERKKKQRKNKLIKKKLEWRVQDPEPKNGPMRVCAHIRQLKVEKQGEEEYDAFTFNLAHRLYKVE